MWLLALPIAVSMAIVGTLATFHSGGVNEQRAATRAEVIRFKVFASAAAYYFDGRAAPAGRSVYSWSDVRVAAPPGVFDAGIPHDWTVVRGVDGKWAACPLLAPESVATVGELLVPPADDAEPRPIALGADFAGVGGFGMAGFAAADFLCKGA